MEMHVVEAVPPAVGRQVLHVFRDDLQEELRLHVRRAARRLEVGHRVLAGIDVEDGADRRFAGRDGLVVRQPGRTRRGCGRALSRRADRLVLLQVFEQGFRRPSVAGGVPVAVVLPYRIPRVGPLAAYVVVLVDDGNAPRFGQSGQTVESEVAPGAHVVYGQDDQRGTVAIGAFPELVQREAREVQGVLVDGRQILSVQERVIHALPRRWPPPVEQRGVARGTPAQQRHLGDQFGIGVVRERSAPLGIQPVREGRHAGRVVRGARVPG